MGVVTGAVIAIVSGTIGFLGSFYLLKKQLEENRKEKIKNRKIDAAKKAIDSLAELLSLISQFSDLNQEIRKITNNRFDFFSLLRQRDYWDHVKSTEPELINLIYKYYHAMAETWKAYGYLRIACEKERSDELKDFTNYLNSLIGQDIHQKWDEMLNKANELIDKIREEIEKLEAN